MEHCSSLAPEQAVQVFDPYYLGITALITVSYQTLFFIITAIFRFDKVTDLAGGTNFLILAIITLCFGGTYYERQVFNSILVSVWAIRLAGFLLYRIIKWNNDNRFDNIRGNIVKLAGFWIIQAVWVWVVSLPLTLLNADTCDVHLNFLDYFAWIMFLAGFFIEVLADFQKLFYKRDHPDHWCNVGLWRNSRHPNYFGEIVMWWSVWISVANTLYSWEWLSIASPLFITFILLFVSGIPIQERSQMKRFQHVKYEYLRYINETSPLIPLPRPLYSALPRIAKLFLCEFPFYRNSDEGAPLVETDGQTPDTK